jgi:hypothetical protein
MSTAKSETSATTTTLCCSLTGDAGLTFAAEAWAGLRLEGLRPALQVDGRPLALSLAATRDCLTCAGEGLTLTLGLHPLEPGGWRVEPRLRVANAGTLNRVDLLASGAEAVCFGTAPAQVRVMTFSRYGGDVVPLLRPSAPRPDASTEPNEAVPGGEPSLLSADDVMVIYDRAAGQALLLGFLGSERWQGQIALTVSPQGEVQRLTLGFDGGDLQLAAGDDLALEPFVLFCGRDPWAALEDYGDLVRTLHGVVCPALPPVSWCSWYPYRLGISEERLLAEARVAAERLRPLGLSVLEADLGWQRQHLPNAFEPNERFPHGLTWLAERLAGLGFGLGLWTAPFTISEFDVLAKAHPEWLVQGEDGAPLSVWTWFWEPHGNIYILDLTHPGAQEWLRQQFADLRAAGVSYLKADFIGMVSDARAKRRHDPRQVAGAGTEAARRAAALIREALPEALILNCGGPSMPGTGAWPLLYACSDTGNTGLISWEFMRGNFRAVACHLWQNRRWSIIQPSCLCVGLPGTLEEARLRATVAFLAGGQIDISDTLTTLPEDRWQVLTATLPPLGLTARPVDLFEPVHHRQAADYAALCKGQPTAYVEREHPPASVWHLRLTRDGDTWDVVACFAFDQRPSSEAPTLTNFTIPLTRLGLAPEHHYWAFEFWSGQFLGTIPGGRANAAGYAHPGDWQDLVTPGPAGTLSISFTGPGVKLLALRPTRSHPWVVGTSFHQSCGAELGEVTWDAAKGELRGVLHRPAGHYGSLFICDAGWRTAAADVDGQTVPLLSSAHGAWRLPLTTTRTVTPWRVAFEVGGGEG